MSNDQNAQWHPPPKLADFRSRRDKLREQLESESDFGAINVDEMMRVYSRVYDQPILTLIQDIQTQMAVYANVIEELKKSGPVDDHSVKGLRERYRAVGLISVTNDWPNPAADWLMNKALSELREYWRALTSIMARSRRKLTDELGLEPTMAIGFKCRSA